MKKVIFTLSLLILFYNCSDNRNHKHSQMSAEVAADSDDMDFEEDGDEDEADEESADMAKDASDNKNASVVSNPKKKKNSKTWKRSSKTPNSVSLFIGDSQKLPLKGSQVSVTIDGMRARVLVDCFYYNDKQGNLEGTFKMRLPQGAKPYYFAFGESVYLDNNKIKIPFLAPKEIDVKNLSPKNIEKIRSKSWTKPKVARIVPKEKASLAYGNTVRRQVDPALAEWAGADVFNCRVFPLSSNKLHRIVIGYDVNLTNLNNDWIYNLPIPKLDCPSVIDFDIANIAGVTTDIIPRQQSRSNNKRTTFRLVDPKEKEIEVWYKSTGDIVLQSPKNNKGSYFACAIKPNLPTKSNGISNENAVIALDVSLSSNPDKFNIWLKLTKAILNNNRSSIKKFNVLLFNVETFWWKEYSVDNTPENVADFVRYANKLALEGASDVGLALAEIAIKKDLQKSNDIIFLLSDGADTWGDNDRHKIANHIKENDVLFAFNTGMSGISLDKLNHLTKTSGGAIFSIFGEDEINKASTAFRSKPWKIENVVVPGTSDVLVAGLPRYVYPGQQLLITGRGSFTRSSKVNMTISQGGFKKDISIKIKNVVESKLTDRIYGQIATETLESFDYTTEKESIAYAKHFNVPGKTCSLLMLETEEDYKQYNIKVTEDAYVVKSTQVTKIIENVLKDISDMLGSSKKRFKKWLTKLTKTDGLEFDIPASLDLVVNKIPESKFLVQQRNLKCKLRFKNGISKEVRDALLKSKLDYDIVSEEAERRLKEYSSNDALKALSSLVEKNSGDAILARDVAYSALKWNLNEQAYFLFKRVLETRPYEPQTYLAIAKTLAKIKNYELSMLYYEIAVTAKWNGRFGQFREIAALDYLNVLREVKELRGFSLKEFANSRFNTIKEEFEINKADLMVVISWNTDNTDVDLHVIEPTGEECSYLNKTTKIGGRITRDVTAGYGPEMYIIEDAKKGKYIIRGKYFSSNRNRTSTRTKIFATIYQNWGTKNQRVINKTAILEDGKDMHDIITVKI